MPQALEQVLQRTELYCDYCDYKLVRLPANGITIAAGVMAEASVPFTALVVDKDEVTLMLPDDVCQAFATRLRLATMSEVNYRLITFDVVLEPDLVGFIARISKSLAEASIPVLTFAAYSRDHIFVPASDFDRAVANLRQMQA